MKITILKGPIRAGHWISCVTAWIMDAPFVSYSVFLTLTFFESWVIAIEKATFANTLSSR